MSDADTIAALRAQLATVRAAAKQLEASFATRDAYERRVLASVAGVERAALLRELDAAREEARQWNAAATRADEERVAARQALGNLLARIHRDGGHRIDRVGWDAAAREADALVVGMLDAARQRDAARAALRSPGETLVCDQLAFDCKVDDFGVKWLRLRLPSGRYLCYMEPEGTPTKCGVCHGQGVVLTGGFVEDQATKPSASYEVCPECGGQGEWGGSELTYMGVDQYTRQWKRQKTYGGKIFENAVQAGARDVFFHGMQLAMQDFGWEPIYDNVQLADGTVGPAIVMWRGTNADGCVVLRVHDELVCEVPDADEYTVDRLSQLMATNPPWAAGLPLAAAGFEARRYRKGD